MVITIVAAFLAVYAVTNIADFLLIPILPIILFWFLDSYYLQQERKFRGLYNDIANVSRSPQDIRPFEMRLDLYKGGKYQFIKVFFSRTIYPIYF